jgi:hypothetical protein
MSYAEANAVRLQFAEAERSNRVSVSPLRRRRDGGWSFTACGRCLAQHDEYHDEYQVLP